MGLTNAEYQRRWRAKHKVESLKHLEHLKLAHSARKRRVGYGSWLSRMSDAEWSRSGVDDDAVNTYLESTKSDDQCWTAREITHGQYHVPQLARGDADEYKTTIGRSPAKREKDALRYLALCVDNPTVFNRTIDTLPDSSIRRICDAVLNASKGDAKYELTPAQRTMCNKYKRSIDILVSPKESLATKRRLLRSAKKQVGGSVFVPMMLQASLDTLGNALIPPTNH
jgi:hypothetical protein